MVRSAPALTATTGAGGTEITAGQAREVRHHGPVLTRRQAIGAGIATLVAAATARGRSRGRVIVVGAGLAGLAAADAAHRAGWDVLVLEARERVGGRVHTLRGFAEHQVAEAGGEFLDSNHLVMRGYARRFGLPLDDLRKAGSDLPGCVYVNGRRRREAVLHTPLVDREIDRFYRALSRLSDPLDPADPVAAGSRLDRRSAADFLDELRLDATAREVIEHQIIRDDYTVEAKDLSLLFLAQGDSLPGGQEEIYRVRGGNDRIPRALARGLGARVVLGAPVSAIAHHQAGVTVTAAGATHAADACVVAVPLPALRAITFSPALPEVLAEAVHHLQYGTGAKVAMQYAGRPWRSAGFDGDTFTDLSVSTTWEATDAQRGPDGILLGYTVGAPGAAYASLSDGDRIAAATADVARIYPGAAGRLRTARTVAWTDEAYTGGTYAAYAPGQVTAYWRALRRPVSRRVLLAGEHTDALTGYMEGAARSGLRAARRLPAGP